MLKQDRFLEKINKSRKNGLIFKTVGFLIVFILAASSLFYFFIQVDASSCDNIINLPLNRLLPQYTINITKNSEHLPIIRGLEFDPNQPSNILFYFDTMNKNSLNHKDKERLVKYFFGFLTIPGEDLWVNLSNYEKDRVATNSLLSLDIGKDMLLEDYLLKQITSYLTDPNTVYGKKYWQDLQTAIYKIAKTKNINIDYNYKIWVVPDKVLIYCYTDSGGKKVAVIKEAKLKVMLDQDYLALAKRYSVKELKNNKLNLINQAAEELFKQQLLPIIQDQVNNSKMFAPLRQLFYSLILATYAKETLSTNRTYRKYINQKKTQIIGLDKSQEVKKTVYDSYINTFKPKIYSSFDREESAKKKKICRYYSGGINPSKISQVLSFQTKSYWQELLKLFIGRRQISLIKVEEINQPTNPQSQIIIRRDGRNIHKRILVNPFDAIGTVKEEIEPVRIGLNKSSSEEILKGKIKVQGKNPYSKSSAERYYDLADDFFQERLTYKEIKSLLNRIEVFISNIEKKIEEEDREKRFWQEGPKQRKIDYLTLIKDMFLSFQGSLPEYIYLISEKNDVYPGYFGTGKATRSLLILHKQLVNDDVYLLHEMLEYVKRNPDNRIKGDYFYRRLEKLTSKDIEVNAWLQAKKKEKEANFESFDSANYCISFLIQRLTNNMIVTYNDKEVELNDNLSLKIEDYLRLPENDDRNWKKMMEKNFIDEDDNKKLVEIAQIMANRARSLSLEALFALENILTQGYNIAPSKEFFTMLNKCVDLSNGVPILIKGVENSSPKTRIPFITAIGEYGQDVKRYCSKDTIEVLKRYIKKEAWQDYEPVIGQLITLQALARIKYSDQEVEDTFQSICHFFSTIQSETSYYKEMAELLTNIAQLSQSWKETIIKTFVKVISMREKGFSQGVILIALQSLNEIVIPDNINNELCFILASILNNMAPILYNQIEIEQAQIAVRVLAKLKPIGSQFNFFTAAQGIPGICRGDIIQFFIARLLLGRDYFEERYLPVHQQILQVLESSYKKEAILSLSNIIKSNYLEARRQSRAINYLNALKGEGKSIDQKDSIISSHGNSHAMGHIIESSPIEVRNGHLAGRFYIRVPKTGKFLQDKRNNIRYFDIKDDFKQKKIDDEIIIFKLIDCIYTLLSHDKLKENYRIIFQMILEEFKEIIPRYIFTIKEKDGVPSCFWGMGRFAVDADKRVLVLYQDFVEQLCQLKDTKKLSEKDMIAALGVFHEIEEYVKDVKYKCSPQNKSFIETIKVLVETDRVAKKWLNRHQQRGNGSHYYLRAAMYSAMENILSSVRDKDGDKVSLDRAFTYALRTPQENKLTNGGIDFDLSIDSHNQEPLFNQGEEGSRFLGLKVKFLN